MSSTKRLIEQVLDRFESRRDKWTFGEFERALEEALGEHYGNYQTAKLAIIEADKTGKWPRTVERYIRTNYKAFGNLPVELNEIGSRIFFSPKQFDELVREVLTANGYKISVDTSGDLGFDFIAELKDTFWAVEVKFYRTARAQISLLNAAAARLASRGATAEVSRGMLIVSCMVPRALRTTLEERFGVALVDRSALLDLAATAPSILDELSSFLGTEPGDPNAEIAPQDVIPSESRTPRGGSADLDKELKESHLPEDTRGTELCAKLKAVKRGKAGWAEYEKVCDSILKYLFPNDLSGWHQQRRTDDKLNRFDYVCRIRSSGGFWQFLMQHMDSRYVLFEFKNYVGKIKQGQILTTEKYLLHRGLRKVAIIFCRAGAERDAVAMMQGAMRENGKLMLVVDDAEVCRMLHMKERGEDPADRLFDLADDFLLALPR